MADRRENSVSPPRAASAVASTEPKTFSVNGKPSAAYAIEALENSEKKHMTNAKHGLDLNMLFIEPKISQTPFLQNLTHQSDFLMLRPRTGGRGIVSSMRIFYAAQTRFQQSTLLRFNSCPHFIESHTKLH
jgi:hypothetical protein